MTASTADQKRLGHVEYWDSRYTDVGPDEQVHEWFRSFNDLAPFFEQYLFHSRPPDTAPKILHLGSGDSTIPGDLAKLGYNHQTCVDFSSVIVRNMSIKHQNFEGIVWQHADVRDMKQILSQSVDVAFDKGTLDAMIHGSPWNPPDEVLENTGRYVREIFRVLRPEGTFLYITYRQPHFVKPLLTCTGTNWDIKVNTLGGYDNSFEYFGFCLKKKKTTTVRNALPATTSLDPMHMGPESGSPS